LDKDYGVVNENRIKFQVKVHYRMLTRVESTPRLETKAQRYVGNALPLASHTSELATCNPGSGRHGFSIENNILKDSLPKHTTDIWPRCVHSKPSIPFTGSGAQTYKTCQHQQQQNVGYVIFFHSFY